MKVEAETLIGIVAAATVVAVMAFTYKIGMLTERVDRLEKKIIEISSKGD